MILACSYICLTFIELHYSEHWVYTAVEEIRPMLHLVIRALLTPEAYNTLSVRHCQSHNPPQHRDLTSK